MRDGRRGCSKLELADVVVVLHALGALGRHPGVLRFLPLPELDLLLGRAARHHEPGGADRQEEAGDDRVAVAHDALVVHLPSPEHEEDGADDPGHDAEGPEVGGFF